MNLLTLIQTAPDWYTLKKRAAYLAAFSEYIRQKVKKEPFQVPKLNSAYLNAAMQRVVRYVQRECFGKMMQALPDFSPDTLEDLINKLATHTANDTVRKHLVHLHVSSIRCLRLYIHPDETLRIEDRMSQSELPAAEKFPIILPSRHSFTYLLVLRCPYECAHGGIQYTSMLTRSQFWIIRGAFFDETLRRKMQSM